MVARKTVRPDMGCHYYTRDGHAAYVAYAFESGSPLPVPKGGDRYARAIGFVYGDTEVIHWDNNGEIAHPYLRGKLDLVERITMECAFQFPKRRKRPKVKPAEQGLLL